MFFDHPEFDAHEQVSWFHDSASGLYAITALHRVRGGSALGGIRIYAYEDSRAALTDVLRLSRAMSYKWALADLGYGGGKTVVILDPAEKTEELLRALGRCVESLGGSYVCAPDVGSNAQDMAVIRKETEHVAGLPGSDTSIPTALGLFHGIRAVVAATLGAESLQGVRVAVQGGGGVGGRVCAHLAEAGAEVLVADIDDRVAAEVSAKTGAEVLPPNEVLAAEVDVLSPCAMGAVLNAQTISTIRARAVCGAANNQLATAEDGDRLREAGITWAPDYVVSAGGIIGGARELGRISSEECDRRLEGIYATLTRVFEESHRQDVNPDVAARRMAAAVL